MTQGSACALRFPENISLQLIGFETSRSQYRSMVCVCLTIGRKYFLITFSTINTGKETLLIFVKNVIVLRKAMRCFIKVFIFWKAARPLYVLFKLSGFSCCSATYLQENRNDCQPLVLFVTLHHTSSLLFILCNM